jgi:hypothetical protein
MRRRNFQAHLFEFGFDFVHGCAPFLRAFNALSHHKSTSAKMTNGSNRPRDTNGQFDALDVKYDMNAATTSFEVAMQVYDDSHQIIG